EHLMRSAIRPNSGSKKVSQNAANAMSIARFLSPPSGVASTSQVPFSSPLMLKNFSAGTEVVELSAGWRRTHVPSFDKSRGRIILSSPFPFEGPPPRVKKGFSFPFRTKNKKLKEESP